VATPRVVSLNEVDDPLIEQWQALARAPLEPNPFVDPDFVLPAVRWLQKSPPGLAVVERGRELVFALPIARLRSGRGLALAATGTWLHPHCFLGTPLVSRAHPYEALAEGLTLLRSVSARTVLGVIGTDGQVAETLNTALGRERRPMAYVDRPGRPVFHCPGSGPDPLSGKRRAKLRRARRALEVAMGGEVACVDHAAPGQGLDHAIQGFLDMEQASWKGRDGGAMAGRPGHAEFFREVCHRFALAGRLQMRSLEVDGKPVAYQCNLLSGSSLFGFKMTFEADYAKYSPGVQLVLETMDDFRSDPSLSTYDSCMGSGASALHQLYPHRRSISDLVLLSGVFGHVAASAAPHLITAYRRAKQVRRPQPQPLA
jgi:CelD/BcsL family acetyltransferase involved in cellulose biosynthesis